MEGKVPLYTKGEEIMNSVSHGVGALFAIAGTVILIVWSALMGGAWEIVSSAIYGFSLIVMYTMSTLYHALTHPAAKKVMRVLDHSSIFLLIAGTYTPISLVTLQHGALGWVVFGMVWACAAVGIWLNGVSLSRFKRLSMMLYMLSGWAIVIAIPMVFMQMHPGGLVLLFAGGLFYTGGILFYAMKQHRWFHGIWHIFVLLGSFCHYFMILFFVI